MSSSTLSSIFNQQSLEQFATTMGKLRPLITVLLVLLVLWVAAKLVWQLLPEPELAAMPAHTKSSANNSKRPALSARTLTASPLFGSAKSNTAVAPKASKPINRDAPQTRLKLTLHGTLASSRQDRARAFISSPGKDQLVYGVDDDINNARIAEIRADRVILERAGRFETLLLIKLDQAAAKKGNNKRPSRNSAPSRIANIGRGASTSNIDYNGNLASVRDQLLENPDEVTNLIRPQPIHRDGALVGYRVYPGKNRQLFRRIGLRSGDLVTAINGTSMTDPTSAAAALMGLSTASSVTVTVERRNKKRDLEVKFE